MDTPIERMPNGIRFFLAYAVALLAGIGISLRYVVDEAISAPISPLGVLVMALLAYSIFTITLVLQRKEAGRAFAFGLASLTVPAVPLLALGGFWVAASVVAAVAIGVFFGLTRPAVRAWLREQ